MYKKLKRIIQTCIILVAILGVFLIPNTALAYGINLDPGDYYEDYFCTEHFYGYIWIYHSGSAVYPCLRIGSSIYLKSGYDREDVEEDASGNPAFGCTQTYQLYNAITEYLNPSYSEVSKPEDDDLGYINDWYPYFSTVDTDEDSINYLIIEYFYLDKGESTGDIEDGDVVAKGFYEGESWFETHYIWIESITVNNDGSIDIEFVYE